MQQPDQLFQGCAGMCCMWEQDSAKQCQDPYLQDSDLGQAGLEAPLNKHYMIRIAMITILLVTAFNAQSIVRPLLLQCRLMVAFALCKRVWQGLGFRVWQARAGTRTAACLFKVCEICWALMLEEVSRWRASGGLVGW